MSAQPFTSTPMDVEAAWTDFNGHLNMAYYNVLFDRGVDQAFSAIGIGPEYTRERRLTVYTAEVHICYVRELHEGSQVTVSTQIIDHDDKRIHLYQEMRHLDGWLAASSEGLFLHIDMGGPRVTPFPSDKAPQLKAMAAAHAMLPRPERIGRKIAIVHKPRS